MYPSYQDDCRTHQISHRLEHRKGSMKSRALNEPESRLVGPEPSSREEPVHELATVVKILRHVVNSVRDQKITLRIPQFVFVGKVNAIGAFRCN